MHQFSQTNYWVKFVFHLWQNPIFREGNIFALPDLDVADNDEKEEDEDEEKPSSEYIQEATHLQMSGKTKCCLE